MAKGQVVGQTTIQEANAPAQPNWAQRYGITNFLDSTLKRTIGEYEMNQKLQSELTLQKAKDAAEMERTQALMGAYQNRDQSEFDRAILTAWPMLDPAKKKELSQDPMIQAIFKRNGINLGTKGEINTTTKPESTVNKYAGMLKGAQQQTGGGAGALLGAGALAGTLGKSAMPAVFGAARNLPYALNPAIQGGATGLSAELGGVTGAGLAAASPGIVPALAAILSSGMAGYGAGRTIGSSNIRNTANAMVPGGVPTPIQNMIPNQSIDQVIQSLMAKGMQPPRE